MVATIAATVLFAKAAKLETLHEGLRYHVYDDHDGSPLHDGVRDRDKRPCVGHPTVGIGCNLDRGGARESLAAVGADYDAVRLGHVDLTREQVDILFGMDLQSAMVAVRQLVPELYDLPEPVQLVLVDMTFNMGSVRGFPRMLAAVRNRDWLGMIREMLDSRWARKGPGGVPARAKHDVELIRTLLVPEQPEHPELTDEDREQIAALVRVATDESLRETLAPHA
jgi:GH24 family phage-related lysozyme (muramidase)